MQFLASLFSHIYEQVWDLKTGACVSNFAGHSDGTIFREAPWRNCAEQNALCSISLVGANVLFV